MLLNTSEVHEDVEREFTKNSQNSGSHFRSFFVDIFSIVRLRNGSHVTYTLI